MICGMLSNPWQQFLLEVIGSIWGPSSIENDAHDIEKLLLKSQVSLTSFLPSEVNQIIHIIYVVISITTFDFSFY